MATGSLVRTFTHEVPDDSDTRYLEGWRYPSGISTVAFAPDGARVVTVGFGDNLARFWEAATGKQIRQFTGPFPGRSYGTVFFPRFIRTVAFSPDGQRLLIGRDDALAEILECAHW